MSALTCCIVFFPSFVQVLSYELLVVIYALLDGSLESRARILEQVTIYRRLLIGRDGHLGQSEAYDIS